MFNHFVWIPVSHQYLQRIQRIVTIPRPFSKSFKLKPSIWPRWKMRMICLFPDIRVCVCVQLKWRFCTGSSVKAPAETARSISSSACGAMNDIRTACLQFHKMNGKKVLLGYYGRLSSMSYVGYITHILYGIETCEWVAASVLCSS